MELDATEIVLGVTTTAGLVAVAYFQFGRKGKGSAEPVAKSEKSHHQT